MAAGIERHLAREFERMRGGGEVGGGGEVFRESGGTEWRGGDFERRDVRRGTRRVRRSS